MWRRSLSCGGREFPEALRPFLFVLYEAKLLGVNDLLPSGIDAATVKAAEDFWKEVVIAVLKAKKEKDGGDDCSALERAALVAWCLTPSSVIVTRDASAESADAPASADLEESPRPASLHCTATVSNGH